MPSNSLNPRYTAVDSDQMQFSNTISGAESAPQYSANSPNQTSYSSEPTKMGAYVTAQSETRFNSYSDFQTGNEKPPIRRRTGSSMFTTLFGGVSHFKMPKMAAPWEHEIDETSAMISQPHNYTVRDFDYRRQRHRLFLNSFFQLFVTVFLSVAMGASIYGFSTVVTGLTPPYRRGFNALMGGLSILLGLNIASSLKHYAQMMRWRFLAAGYRSLQDFELVLNCDSLLNCVRMLWAGRTRGRFYPNKAQVLAFVWLTINIAVLVITALLGLTYNLDVSELYVQEEPGTVNVAELSFLYPGGNPELYPNFERTRAQEYMIAGANYGYHTGETSEYIGSERSYVITPDALTAWYPFVDRSPEKETTSALSFRHIESQATCEEWTVTRGGYAGFDEIVSGFSNDTESNFTALYVNDTQNAEWYFYISDNEQDPAATTWLTVTDPTLKCGDRCSTVYALLSSDKYTDSEILDVPEPRFFHCNNTVSHVFNREALNNDTAFDVSDTLAWIMAGAIGADGHTRYYNDGNGTVETLLYQHQLFNLGSSQTLPGNVTAEGAALVLMASTAKAFSALDANGLRVNITNPALLKPVPAQVLKVNWSRTFLVLASVPFIQAVVMLCVILWANKAVIKDGSFLSTARLLRPVVEQLGDNGCLLTADEIAEVLGNYKIVYAPRLPSGISKDNASDAIKHLDIVKESEGVDRWHGRMPAGRYDGVLRNESGSDEEKQGLLAGESEVYRTEGQRKRTRRGSV